MYLELSETKALLVYFYITIGAFRRVSLRTEKLIVSCMKQDGNKGVKTSVKECKANLLLGKRPLF